MAYTYINGAPWEQQFAFNTSAPSDITSWSTGAALPATALRTGTIIPINVFFIKNKVYVSGYYDTGVSEYRLYVADVDSSGVVGSFSVTAIVPPVLGGAVFTTGNLLYTVGGAPVSGGGVGSSTAKVYYSTINESTGEISSFSDTGNDYPVSIAGSSAAVTQDRVYIIGGGLYNSFTNYVYVYTATIGKYGVLGSWSAATDLREFYNSYQQTVAVAGAQTAKKISVLGGRRTSSTADSIISCDSSGVFTGSWSDPSNMLGLGFYGHATAVCSNRVFLFGGYNGTDGTSAVYTAPLDSSGNVSSAWSTLGTSLPHAKSMVAAFLTSSRLYLIGHASTATDYRTTLYTSFSGGANDYLSQTRSGSPDVECWLLGA